MSIGNKVFSYESKSKYNINDLISSYNRGNRNKYIFFFGHRKAEPINEECLSQWYESEFIVEGKKYLCMEQYMMAEKARVFNDTEIEKRIMNSTNQKEIKALGRKVRNFDNNTWDKFKQAVVMNGNYSKFSQNEKLKNYLLSTGNLILVEASPYDSIWGIKKSKYETDITNPNTWRGLNLLGFALMEVRDKIR